MEELNIILVFLSVVITYWVATRDTRKVNQSEGAKVGEMTADLKHIRTTVDAVSNKQDLQGEQILGLVAQIAKLEEKCDNQDRRLDQLERGGV